jgi:hypothetical protein
VLKWQDLCKDKDDEIAELARNWKSIHEEYARQVKEFTNIMRENEELKMLMA